MREAIVQALARLLATDSFFPAAEIDAPEPEALIDDTPGLAGGLSHFAAVQDCPSPEVTRDGGPEDSWELRGAFEIAYIVQAAPAYRRAQRARVREAERKIAALIAGDHTLGLSVETYAEVGPPERHSLQPVAATEPCLTTIVTINVDFTAPSAAG